MAKAAERSQSRALRPRIEDADRVGTSICPFCAVGCAQLVYAKHGKPLHIEGDPRSPVNQGTLCPKGAGTPGMLLSEQRVNQTVHPGFVTAEVRDGDRGSESLSWTQPVLP